VSSLWLGLGLFAGGVRRSAGSSGQLGGVAGVDSTAAGGNGGSVVGVHKGACVSVNLRESTGGSSGGAVSSDVIVMGLLVSVGTRAAEAGGEAQAATVEGLLAVGITLEFFPCVICAQEV